MTIQELLQLMYQESDAQKCHNRPGVYMPPAQLFYESSQEITAAHSNTFHWYFHGRYLGLLLEQRECTIGDCNGELNTGTDHRTYVAYL